MAKLIIAASFAPLLLLTLHLAASPSAHAVLTVWVHSCNNTDGNYTSNSAYKQNLDSLFAKATTTDLNYGFYNFSAGQSPDTANLISLCLGNIDAAGCHQCQKAVIGNLTQMCPTQRTAIAWSDDCVVRYSNKPIFGVLEEDPPFQMLRYLKASNDTIDKYSSMVAKLLDSLPGNASAGDSQLKFASAQADYNSTLTIFAAAQCTPDLTREDCLDCLKAANNLIQSCPDCRGQRGARELLPSCMVRYEEGKFYQSESSFSTNTSGVAPSTSAVAPVTPSTRVVAPVTPSTSAVAPSAGNAANAATERYSCRSSIVAVAVFGACLLALL